MMISFRLVDIDVAVVVQVAKGLAMPIMIIVLTVGDATAFRLDRSKSPVAIVKINEGRQTMTIHNQIEKSIVVQVPPIWVPETMECGRRKSSRCGNVLKG